MNSRAALTSRAACKGTQRVIGSTSMGTAATLHPRYGGQPLEGMGSGCPNGQCRTKGISATSKHKPAVADLRAKAATVSTSGKELTFVCPVLVEGTACLVTRASSLEGTLVPTLRNLYRLAVRYPPAPVAFPAYLNQTVASERRSEKPPPTMDLPLDRQARPRDRNSQHGLRCSPSRVGAAMQLTVPVSSTKH